MDAALSILAGRSAWPPLLSLKIPASHWLRIIGAPGGLEPPQDGIRNPPLYPPEHGRTVYTMQLYCFRNMMVRPAELEPTAYRSVSVALSVIYRRIHYRGGGRIQPSKGVPLNGLANRRPRPRATSPQSTALLQRHLPHQYINMS